MQEMMKSRDEVIADLREYNQDPFHLRHALTVGAVMSNLAKKLGYENEAKFWEQAGILHDIDFEKFPEQHCQKAREILQEKGYSDELIHAVLSHGYGSCSDVKPEKEMEKVLFAVDELTGLIWSASLVRPSKSTKDMDVKSVKKKFKDKSFAAGCDRPTISRGAEQLGWELSELFEKTLTAMPETEDAVEAELAQWTD